MKKLKMKIINENYKVDEVNNVVMFTGIFTFLFSGEEIYTEVFKGKARCSAEDTFDPQFGKGLARQKAVVKARLKFEKLMKSRMAEYNYSISIITDVLEENSKELSEDSKKLLNKLN